VLRILGLVAPMSACLQPATDAGTMPTSHAHDRKVSCWLTTAEFLPRPGSRGSKSAEVTNRGQRGEVNEMCLAAVV
jgi:hypothetical protein